MINNTVRQDEEKLIAEFARKDFLTFMSLMQNPFEDNWHFEVFCDALYQVYKGLRTRDGIKKLMIAAPPQMSKKSTTISAFQAFVLGNIPNISILFGSYNQDLTFTQTKIAQEFVKDPQFAELFNASLARKRRGVKTWGLEFAPSNSGIRTFTMNAVPSGHKCDLMIIDDPIANAKTASSKKNRDSVWNTFKELRDRLIPDVGAVVVIFTRWNLDDPIGREEKRLLNLGKKLEDEWTVIDIPAIAPKDITYKLSTGEEILFEKGTSFWEDLFPLPSLEKRREEVGDYDWHCRYLQSPINKGVTSFDATHFKEITEEEIKSMEDNGDLPYRILMIDPSDGDKGQDFTGFADARLDKTLGIWYLEVWHEKLKAFELSERIKKLDIKNGYDAIGIEGTSGGNALANMYNNALYRRDPFTEETNFDLIEILVISHKSTNKQDRVEAVLPKKFVDGEIFFIKDKCDILKAELEEFPFGSNDDTVDATTYIAALIEQAELTQITEEELKIYV